MQYLPFKNPFTRIWADYYKTPQGFFSHFSERIIPLIPTFFDYPNIFLYGGTGTGKTMLFRYLSFEIQKSYCDQERNDIQTLRDFFEFSSEKINKALGRNISYFGIYSKLTEIPSKLFKNKCKDKQEEQSLFSIYLDLELSTKFITSLAGLIGSCGDTKGSEDIKSKLLRCVKRCSELPEAAEFSDIAKYLSDKKKQIDLYLASLQLNGSLSPPRLPELKITGLVKLFLNIAEVLKTQVEQFREVKIYVLLDEYEGIEEHQKILINTLIRERNRFVEFKMSARRYGLTTFQTLNTDDFIIMGRDAEIIDLEYVFRNNKAKYKRLLFDAAKKRLESEPFFKDRRLTNIKKLLASITPEKEAKALIVKKRTEFEHRRRFRNFLAFHHITHPDETIKLINCDQNPLIEKLNMLLVKRRLVYEERGLKGKRLFKDTKIHEMATKFMRSPSKKTPYYFLYQKNKIALLFQLVSEYGKYGKRKIYADFDTFSALSGGFIAWFLELCYNSLEFAKDRSSSKNSFETKIDIDVESQRRAAEKVSWDFLENVVKNLPRVGDDIYYFVLNTGAFLRALYSDELVREPEPTYFNTRTVELKANSKKVIETAHFWSVLQSKKPMKPKTAGVPLPDVHILHPILSPAFQISYRTRGRTHLLSKEVELLISGSESDIKMLVSKYREKSLVKRNRGKYGQLSFSNL